MKNTISHFFIFVFFITFTIPSFAQSTYDIPDDWPIPDYSDECLGIHCGISVDLNNDPIFDGYLKYTILIPSEGYSFISGPLSVYTGNPLGNTIDIYVHRLQLELALQIGLMHKSH